MKVLELKIPPIVLVAIVAACMWAVSRIWPSLSFTILGATWLSSGIAVVGVCIILLGILEFISVGTTMDPRVPDRSTSLVVRGIYRHSRNPMYVGFLLVLCAWGLYLSSALSLLFLPVFIAYMNRFQIIPEERYMRDKFAEEYTKYTSEVRRWV
ncbi:methyltransferase family protein [Nitrosomonas cryotolerans]|uniref:methyltransferase family protein n=1 Tax=Nitrosomonas cryotolerans TaxID=44575 RepID=UPI000491B65B|nr:isoprenylcysteine carboxylmethyltransferase family protein [Nitrosomonas cryotolerans]